MKKILFTAITLASMVACNRKPNVDYAIISGKIKTTEKTLKLIQNQELLKEIQIQKDGSFRDTIRNIGDKNYFYLAVDPASVLPLFLEGGSDVSLEIKGNIADAKVTENDKSENTKYLNFKDKYISENLVQRQEMLFAQSPTEFKKNITTSLEKLRDELKKYKTDDTFSELENKWIDFQIIFMLKNYPSINQYLTQKEKPIQTPKNFEGNTNDIDYDNNLYFSNLDPYRKLVQEHYLNDFFKKMDRGENLKKDFETLEKIKSESIKDNFSQIFVQFVGQNTANSELFYQFILKNSKDKRVINEAKRIVELTKKTAAGSFAPSFNYENYNGGTTSLESLKGKPVYIDIWASWCGPCRGEIPYLKNLEKQFHDKVHFVSISIDEEKNHWKDFVKANNLVGIQLFGGAQAQILQDYSISEIPRFILIDKNGKIVASDAPRPSSENTIIEILNNLIK